MKLKKIVTGFYKNESRFVILTDKGLWFGNNGRESMTFKSKRSAFKFATS